MQNRARFRDCLFYDPVGVPTPSIRQFVLRGKMGRAAAKTVTKSAPCKYSSHTQKKKKVSARSLPSTEISVRQSQDCVDLRLKLIICSDKRASLGGLQWVNAVIVDLFKRLDTFIRFSMGSRTFLSWQDKNQGGFCFLVWPFESSKELKKGTWFLSYVLAQVRICHPHKPQSGPSHFPPYFSRVVPSWQSAAVSFHLQSSS